MRWDNNGAPRDLEAAADALLWLDTLDKMTRIGRKCLELFEHTSPPRKPLTDDSTRLEWLMRMVSGKEFRRIGVHSAGNVSRTELDAAIESAKGITS